MHEFVKYIDYNSQILIVLVVAEIIRLILVAGKEYIYHKHKYPPNKTLISIASRVFSCNTTRMIVIIIAALRLAMATVMPIAIILFWFMPLYWFLRNALESELDYAHWIRGDHGLDLASGMALTYYYGYLKFVAPTIKQRIESYENKNGVRFAINRLIVLISKTMFMDSCFDSKYLEIRSPLEDVELNRAGVQRRPYRNAVYRLRIRDKFYYVAIEGNTALLSLYEAMSFNSQSRVEQMQREIFLKFCKHLKKLIQLNNAADKVEIIIYNDYTADNYKQDVGENLIAHIENMWNDGKA